MKKYTWRSWGLNEYLNEDFDQDDCFMLDKVMYVMLKESRQHYKNFIQIMTSEMGFERFLADGCLLKRKNDVGTFVLFFYVYDTIYNGDREAIEKFKEELKKKINTKDEGKIYEYVGFSMYIK